MTIKEIKISELKEYENNPRNNESAVDAVAASIENFGFRVPIVIDKYNIIIAGHTRLKAAKKLGIEKVPCIVADDLTEEQAKAFRLADNKTTELAEWDIEKLESELAELKDFDMEQLGFDLSEFDTDGENEREDISDKLKEQFEIIVECQNENEMEMLFERFTEEGLKCRISTL